MGDPEYLDTFGLGPELWTSLRISRFTKILPIDYRVRLVRNSAAYLALTPLARWCKDDIGGNNTWAIEVVNPRGRVMAGVIWTSSYFTKVARDRAEKNVPRSVRSDIVVTRGTFVGRRIRRRGVAQALWQAMLMVTGAKKIVTEPVTNYGWTLVASLQEKLRGRVQIEIDDWSARDLYDLRRKRVAA